MTVRRGGRKERKNKMYRVRKEEERSQKVKRTVRLEMPIHQTEREGS